MDKLDLNKIKNLKILAKRTSYVLRENVWKISSLKVFVSRIYNFLWRYNNWKTNIQILKMGKYITYTLQRDANQRMKSCHSQEHGWVSMLSEKSHTEKGKYQMASLPCGI